MENKINNPNLNSTLQRSNPPTLQPLYKDPDEINLLEYIYALVKNKWWIIGATLLGLALGYGAAKLKGPQWVAEVLIAPKESESQKTPSFSGLGAFGGLVAGQLNMPGNASLDKIDLILSGREFNARLIEKYDLLPIIYKYQWPKAYLKAWDSVHNQWRPDFIPPNRLDIGGMLKGYLEKTTNKNNTMLLKIHSKDSTFSFNLANNYINFLNEYIKTTVQSDAKENVLYLEKQLNSIADPLLREKIQTLIANEIEKQMVVSKEAFKIVDPVFLSKSFKEKRTYPPLLGFVLFFVICLFIILKHAFTSSEKTDEDKQLIEKLKHEIFIFSSQRKR
jgi:hypothetical protein